MSKFQFKTYKPKSFDRVVKNKAAGKRSFESWLTAEQKEHRGVVKWLELLPELKEAVWFHYPAEGKKSAFERWLWSIMGCKKDISDFIFLEARGMYNGLVLELKASGVKVFTDKGPPMKRYQGQHEFLTKMKARGYFAEFAVGPDQFMNFVKAYFNIK